ncbi:hypothetical protein PA6_009_00450 [Aquipseudomonas alcaligenes NBRC 14159]|uniref:DUF2591 domain-containing protein n=2 Tax=Aquipseudomonas alcaligenes TaxID=43263 RepID=U2ZKM3_AQUA1|nr:hypothetical protein PA6_009_00450 [Pseudomonas alcaligenes NBRC 14159]
MAEVEVSALTGPALDWALAKAMGWQMVSVPPDIDGNNSGTVLAPPDFTHDFKFPQRGVVGPGFFLRRWSTCWSDGGPLIERFRIDLGPHQLGWLAYAQLRQGESCEGPTPLIACCRAIVRVKLGTTVAVPAELIG